MMKKEDVNSTRQRHMMTTTMTKRNKTKERKKKNNKRVDMIIAINHKFRQAMGKQQHTAVTPRSVPLQEYK